MTNLNDRNKSALAQAKETLIAHKPITDIQFQDRLEHDAVGIAKLKRKLHIATGIFVVMFLLVLFAKSYISFPEPIANQMANMGAGGLMIIFGLVALIIFEKSGNDDPFSKREEARLLEGLCELHPNYLKQLSTLVKEDPYLANVVQTWVVPGVTLRQRDYEIVERYLLAYRDTKMFDSAISDLQSPVAASA